VLTVLPKFRDNKHQRVGYKDKHESAEARNQW
jgi:hypothetical protein